MNHVFKSIIVTLISTLVLTSAFGQQVIELYSNVSGKLELSDGETTSVGWLGRVYWIISDKKDNKVESFRIERKSKHNIFIGTPEGAFVTSLNLRASVFIFRDWDYRIIWNDKTTSKEYKLDPKIAIKPPGLNILVLIIVIITGFSVFFYRRWRYRKQ